MKRQFILTMLITIFVIASNIPAKGQITPGQIMDRFFEIYSNDQDKAIDYAFSTNKWTEQKKEDLDTLKLRLKETINSSGEYFGSLKIAEKNTGGSVKLIVYYLKYDRAPIRMDFFFYKPNDKWQMQSISFDEESLDNYLEETSKLSMPKEN